MHYCLFSFLIFSLLATSSIKLNLNLNSKKLGRYRISGFGWPDIRPFYYLLNSTRYRNWIFLLPMCVRRTAFECKCPKNLVSSLLIICKHWPTFKQAYDTHYKLTVLVFRCLNGLAPSYLSCDLLCVSDLAARQRLRSSSMSTLVVPPTRLSTAGDRAFPVAAARTWNSLSRSLTSLSSLASFRRQLKTALFTRSFPDLDSSAHDRIWQILSSNFADCKDCSLQTRVLSLSLAFVRYPCSLSTLRHLNLFFL